MSGVLLDFSRSISCKQRKERRRNKREDEEKNNSDALFLTLTLSRRNQTPMLGICQVKSGRMLRAQKIDPIGDSNIFFCLPEEKKKVDYSLSLFPSFFAHLLFRFDLLQRKERLYSNLFTLFTIYTHVIHTLELKLW